MNRHHIKRGICWISKLHKFFEYIRKTRFLALPFVLYAFAYNSQVQAVPDQPGNWLIYFGNQQFHEKWLWQNEIQHRNYQPDGNLEQLLIRTGIGYDVFKNLNLLMGYGFIHSEPYSAITRLKSENQEHRTYQQALAKHSLGRLYFAHRFRLEERFIESDFKGRFRYFLSVNIPVNQPNMKAGALYVSLYSELFANLDTNWFDRNRIFAALGYVPADSWKIEMGLMTQILEKTDRTQLQFVVFNNLPL